MKLKKTAMKLPERIRGHVLETESEKLFLNYLPNEWTFDKKTYDYGIDYEVELFKDNMPTGKRIHFQLKGHESYDEINDCIKQTIKVSTLNYYLLLKDESMMGVYSSKGRSMYYLYLNPFISDVLNVICPNWKNQETTTIYIPIDQRYNMDTSIGNPFKLVEDYCLNEHEKKVQSSIQTIKILQRLGGKDSWNKISSIFLTSPDSSVLIEILNLNFFKPQDGNQIDKTKLIQLLESTDGKVVIQSILCLRYYLDDEVLQKLTELYEHLYFVNQSGERAWDWEDFKSGVAALLETISFNIDKNDERIVRILVMEFVAPLRNWLGQKAGRIILSMWDDFSEKNKKFIGEKILAGNNGYYKMKESIDIKEIVQNIIDEDYCKSFK